MLLQPEYSAGTVYNARSRDTQSRHLDELLHHRMSKPQRHRLLHGFPLAAAMPFASDEVRKLSDANDERFVLRHHLDRELLVGVANDNSGGHM